MPPRQGPKSGQRPCALGTEGSGYENGFSWGSGPLGTVTGDGVRSARPGLMPLGRADQASLITRGLAVTANRRLKNRSQIGL